MKTIRKVLVILLFVILVLPCIAQGSLDNLSPVNKDIDRMINDAIKKGPVNGVYLINNTSNKAYSVEDVTKYLNAKGYTTGASSSKKYNRFGSYISILNTIEFMNPQDAGRYAFSKLKGSVKANYTYDQLKGKGSLLYPDVKVEGTIWGFSTVTELGTFTEIKDVLWSGDVAGGFIKGDGVGFAKFEDKWMLFEGSFYDGGFPSSNLVVNELSSDNKITQRQLFNTNYINIESAIVEATPSRSDDLYKAKEEYLRERITSDSKVIADEYSRALALNNGWGQFGSYLQNRNAIQSFIDTYKNYSHLDRDGWLDKARELLVVYQIMDGLTIDTKKDYRAVSLAGILGGYDDFDRRAVERDRETISNAQTLASRNSERKSDFNRFYSTAVRDLYDIEDDLEENLVNTVGEYNEYRREASKQSHTYSSSSSSSSKKSCIVHLIKKDGNNYSYGEFVAGFSGEFMLPIPTWGQSLTTDGDGYATITWDEDDANPDFVAHKTLNPFEMDFDVDDLDMEDGGSYTICINCD